MARTDGKVCANRKVRERRENRAIARFVRAAQSLVLQGPRWPTGRKSRAVREDRKSRCVTLFYRPGGA